MAFKEIILHAARLDAQRDFYRHTLGLAVSGSSGQIIVQAGATRLIFEQAAPGMNPVYHFAFNIPENQFAEAKAWVMTRTPLLTRDGTQDEFAFEAWNAHAFYFADPAGNILEGIARHNLPNATARPFSGNGLLCVSEIGLPAPEVPQVVDRLVKGVGVPLWYGDRVNFAAVGDEDGLFIVVPGGRPWLPDDRIVATPYPVTVTLAGASPATYSLPALPYTIHIRPD